MKKFICIIAIALALLLCACGVEDQQFSGATQETNMVEDVFVHITFRDLDHDVSYSAELNQGVPIIVGRRNTSDIVIPDEHVSRNHCKITYKDGVLLVEDLDSTNGTFLMKNESVIEVTEIQELAEGNTLILADVYLKLESIE